jgi:hypothetical protein
MNKLCKLGFLLVFLSVFALSGCDLWDQIKLEWQIDGYALSGSYSRVYYTVRNTGFYDLSGINVTIEVSTVTGAKYTGRTTSFSLDIGDSTNSAFLDVNTYGNAPVGAVITGVDMDNPKD